MLLLYLGDFGEGKAGKDDNIIELPLNRVIKLIIASQLRV